MPITKLGYLYFRVGESFEVQLLTPGVMMPNDRGITQLYLGNQSIRHVLMEAKFVNPDGSRSKWCLCQGAMCKWCNGGLSRVFSIEEIPIKIDGAAIKMTLTKWQHDKWVKELEAEKAANHDPLAVSWKLTYVGPRNFTAERGTYMEAQKIARPHDNVAIALTPQELDDIRELLKVLEPMGKSFPEEQYVAVLSSPSTFNWNPTRARDVVRALLDAETGKLDIRKATPPTINENPAAYSKKDEW